MNGILVIDKPSGMTSHDVVARVRRLLAIKRVGHTGTLDPLATGVLVICVGTATRIADYLMASRKEYVAGVAFGVTTDSQDITGQVLGETDASTLTAAAIQSVLPRFTGTIRQIPPMVSAVHHKGKRLYELARKGIEVEREAREVQVYRLEASGFHPGVHPRVTLTIECSTGTYIRTLAADIGAAVGVGATMESLRRTRSGAFTLEDSLTLEQLADMREAGTLEGAMRSIADALSDWPRTTLTDTEIACILQGQTIGAGSSRTWEAGELGLLLDASGETIAIGRASDGRIAPVKVLKPTAGDARG